MTIHLPGWGQAQRISNYPWMILLSVENLCGTLVL
jgi:hypothetical protein